MAYGGSVIDDGCTYVAATSCPEMVEDSCSSELQDCYGMLESGEMCTADTVLPNGDTAYNVQNCDGKNVFVYTCLDEDSSDSEDPVDIETTGCMLENSLNYNPEYDVMADSPLSCHAGLDVDLCL